MQTFQNVIKLILVVVMTTTSSLGIFTTSSAAVDESIFDDMYTTDYTVTGGYVDNIPYDDYLTYAESYADEKAEAKAEAAAIGYTFIDVVADGYDLSENNTGKENAAAINEAITVANAAGGGTVYISNYGAETTFEIVTIVMQSNVTLKVGTNTTLQCIDYDQMLLNSEVDGSSGLSSAVIKVYNCDNVTIEGPGTIDGQGQTYMNESYAGDGLSLLASDITSFNLKEYNLAWREYITYKTGSRVQLIRTSNVDGLTIENIELYNSGGFVMWIEETDNILVEYTILNNNLHTENGDGVDYLDCNNVVMHDCFISAADDGMSIKSYDDGGCYNYEFYNCEIISNANCFKIGTPTATGIGNIEVYDCQFFKAGTAGGYAGIAIESVDGSNLEDVYVHDIQMDGILSPLLIWLGYRMSYSTETVGSLSNVVIENIEANNVYMASAVVGCTNGLTDFSEIHYVTDVTIKNFVVKYREGVTSDLDLPGVLECIFAQSAAEVYPEITKIFYMGMGNYEDSLMYDIPVYGLYCRYVDGITVENFYVMPREDNELALDNIQSVFDRYFVSDVTWTYTDDFDGIDFDA
ncbi:MAG: glycosyl hydrolase family 28 protein [Clostridia bacterium]